MEWVIIIAALAAVGVWQALKAKRVIGSRAVELAQITGIPPAQIGVRGDSAPN